jgi:hypothetical protein
MDSIVAILVTLVRFENRIITVILDTFFTREFGKQCGNFVADFLCSGNFRELAYEIHNFMEVEKTAKHKKDAFLLAFNEIMNRIDNKHLMKTFNNIVNYGNEEGVENSED